jgi:hypothetical protein
MNALTPDQRSALVRLGIGLAALVVVALVVAAVTGGGGSGVDEEALASSVEVAAAGNWELADDFQEISDCVEQAPGHYECVATGDDGQQSIDVELVDDAHFRVDEPEINVFLEGEITD